MRHEVQDGEPDADVLRPLGHGAAGLAHELLRVQPDLHPVVEQREERRQREGRHEDGDEAKLEDCGREEEERVVREGLMVCGESGVSGGVSSSLAQLHP